MTASPSRVSVHVYCGNFVGPPKWQGIDYYEPDECSYEGYVDAHPEELDVTSWECPGCKATNTLRDHEVTDPGETRRTS